MSLQYPNTKCCLEIEEYQSIEKNETEHSTAKVNLVSAECIYSFYPKSVESIPYGGKDLLKRLLEVNPRFRLRSVIALQKISMYMDFKVNEGYVLNQSPLQIMEDNGILISELNNQNVDFTNF